MSHLRRALSSTIPRILNANSVPYHPRHRIQPVGIIDLSTEESKRRLFNRLTWSWGNGCRRISLLWINPEFDRLLMFLTWLSFVEGAGRVYLSLWKWLTGQEQAPEAISSNPVFLAVRTKVMGNLDNHASPETRATAGQPWVRGWDDFKKGKDSPIVGNQ